MPNRWPISSSVGTRAQEKNETALKQDQSKNPQSNKDTDATIEKDKIQDEKNKEVSNGKKVKELEEKILRTLAEMENQRRRFEKERQEYKGTFLILLLFYS